MGLGVSGTGPKWEQAEVGTGGSGNGPRRSRSRATPGVPSARTVSTAITAGVADGSPSFMAELDDFETERGEVLHDQVKARRRPRRAGAGLRGQAGGADRTHLRRASTSSAQHAVPCGRCSDSIRAMGIRVCVYSRVCVCLCVRACVRSCVCARRVRARVCRCVRVCVCARARV